MAWNPVRGTTWCFDVDPVSLTKLSFGGDGGPLVEVPRWIHCIALLRLRPTQTSRIRKTGSFGNYAGPSASDHIIILSMTSNSSRDRPPHFVLVAHTNANSANSRTLIHPTIQHSFTDDSPLTILPRSDQDHVLVLDYKPDGHPTAQSISGSVIVTGVNTAPAMDEGNANDQMYTIETTSNGRPKSDPQLAPGASLRQFKERNAMLRAALQYPESTS
ncbi:hypothetical protein DL96DRAFT_42248 [Flagelloscypha sp. PMI_526]|nr:hypothetical protein DL96DRAFT_42248 [Flagelloscypha sp. PMI_526]